MKNPRVVALVVALVAVLFALGCSGGEEGIGGSGFIEATSVVVSSEASGRLEALDVDEGDWVEAGTVIGIIDSTTVRLQLDRTFALRQAALTAVQIAKINIEQAEQDAALAKKEYDRIASLLEKGSANQQQYDQAQNRFKQSQLTMRLARATHDARKDDLARINSDIALLERQLANCFPTAPVSGVIVDKLIERGELLAPGKPIVEIAKMDTVWVKAYLPAGDLTAIELGGSASVDPEDGRKGPLVGRIVWISDRAQFTPKNVQTAQARADLVYAVKVTVANPDGALKIGMPVMVRFTQ